jgi:DNA uptake protein ComE-like DNA-binding protein
MVLNNIVLVIAFMRITITGFQELDMRPGIGKKTAQRTIENRPVDSIDDLKRIPGIKAKTSEKITPQIEL